MTHQPKSADEVIDRLLGKRLMRIAGIDWEKASEDIREAKAQLLEDLLGLVGEDGIPQFEDGSGEYQPFCMTCDFVPTDDTSNCLCYYRNNLRTQLREAIKEYLR